MHQWYATLVITLITQQHICTLSVVQWIMHSNVRCYAVHGVIAGVIGLPCSLSLSLSPTPISYHGCRTAPLRHPHQDPGPARPAGCRPGPGGGHPHGRHQHPSLCHPPGPAAPSDPAPHAHPVPHAAAGEDAGRPGPAADPAEPTAHQGPRAPTAGTGRTGELRGFIFRNA